MKRLICVALAIIGVSTVVWSSEMNDTIKGHNVQVLRAEDTDIKIYPAEDCMRYGMNSLESKNYQDALVWFWNALQQGETNAGFYLGLMFLQGQGIDAPDPKQAEKFFVDAAEAGVAPAAVNIATMYMGGIGVERDMSKAYTWMKKAAEMADGEAQHILGVMIARGEGTEMNEADGLAWMLKAAEQGIPKAQQDVGVMYLNGRGTAQSYEEAFRWILKAAEQGVAESQFMVASFYFNGQGVAKDENAALEWTKKAARQGEPRALRIVQAFNLEL